jgi:hypothetical protein
MWGSTFEPRSFLLIEARGADNALVVGLPAIAQLACDADPSHSMRQPSFETGQRRLKS